jgi:AraC family transcriptional regulator
LVVHVGFGPLASGARETIAMVVSRMATRPEWKALKTVHARANADVLLTSLETGWNAAAVSRFRLGRVDVSLPPLAVPAFGINYGHSFKLERTLHGRRTSATAMPGHLAILPADAPTRWVFDKQGDIVLVYLSPKVLEEAITQGAEREATSAELVPRFLIRDLALERIAHLLLREICEPGPDSRLSADVLAQDLAEHLVATHSNRAPRSRRRPHAIAPGCLRRAREFMRGNLSRPMSLQEIADSAGVSAFHFARGFRRATGLPPHQYLTEQRLLKARILLHNPSLSIGEVAQAVGFTHSHFTALFTRRLGMTPTKFREVLRV